MTNDSTKKHWDEFWTGGTAEAEATEPNWKLVEMIMSLGDPAGWKVMEVGAGRGADTVYLVQHGAEGYVLDFSEHALEITASLAARQNVSIKTIQADALQIPFPDDTFDLIFHQGFLEHFHDPVSILAEQRRVLKPGGYLLVDVPQKYCLYTLRKQLAMRRGKWFAGWETQFSPAEIESLVKQGGFELVTTYGWGWFSPAGWAALNFIHRTKTRIKKKSHEKTGEQGSESYKRLMKKPVTMRHLLYLADNVGVVCRKPSSR